MDIKAARRTERFGARAITCVYWQAGKCNRNPCSFLHRETPIPPNTGYCNGKSTYSHKCMKKPHSSANNKSSPKHNSKNVFIRKMGGGSLAGDYQKPSQSICRYWVNGNCVRGEHCRDLHSWFYGDGFSTLAKLREHKKVITGIALPAGSDKLYSGSTDGTIRTWDCHTGKCVNVVNLGAEVISMISEGPWIFIGLRNAIKSDYVVVVIVKAWNVQAALEFTLDGPKGRALSIVVGSETLFAGDEDGVISAWRGGSESISPFKLVASLNGHTSDVVCLAVGGKMLYSGSMDHSIKVWDMDTLDCKMTLSGHADTVTSLICWDSYLLSSSFDCTVKVWVATEEGSLKVTYTHREENGVLALCGMTDADAKPILFCSCLDNSVRLYELPSFSERGRLFARREVRSLEIGPGGLFFTGDGTGSVTVWKWLDEPKVSSS
ncbi:zinc finger CCCH domain-containing protein 48 isoform X1 [Arachis ipaensis]|uniref:zinc finger CCCH domain-containing protein 48 isoform X1 n=1 Tax=Arachis ipaensis TaxID=130454 RepID=UPI000A2B45E0|nr:zinc finger CCCH domain-containing protein 48 isoform X1 [Arachis ipaensis]XP_020969936.1 zinc finger CCCH domain-containing protein 48 isoform X1 [Arachis ipaensis]XP_025680671.1 zinc finger CCCH domain-containing protein 48 isoform X1 [Arachis hypogaea]XP_025680672.1 zinc finger CCCH domain-containing protein 48 isoform X1 [Arachis hypogaea]